jgi:hypothetical protein
MLEARVVASPTSLSWDLDLSYEQETLNLEGTSVASSAFAHPVVASPIVASSAPNNTPPVSTNGDEDIEDVGTSCNGEGSSNNHDGAIIGDEYLELARTLKLFGRDRVQELVLLIQSPIFLHCELTSTYADCQAVRRNLEDLHQGAARQNSTAAFPSGFEPYFYRADSELE